VAEARSGIAGMRAVLRMDERWAHI
jgi:hypothetical protein